MGKLCGDTSGHSQMMEKDILEKNEEFYALAISILRNWQFDLGEYMKNPDRVLEEAARLVPRGNEHDLDIGRCLEYLFRKRVCEAASWLPFPEPVLMGDTLQISYDGKEYRSVIRFSRHELEVILEDSRQPLRRTATLPESSNVSFTDLNGDTCSWYGILKAKEMILALVLENHYLRIS